VTVVGWPEIVRRGRREARRSRATRLPMSPASGDHRKSFFQETSML
jgi:hypothetical protein